MTFWRRNGGEMLETSTYPEIAPHLILMAFLHRVINAGGTMTREFALGTKRMDLCIEYGDVTLAIELKAWRDKDKSCDPLDEGLEQLDEYLAKLGLDTGWLIIFDQRSGLPRIEERTTASEATTPSGRTVTVVRA